MAPAPSVRTIEASSFAEVLRNRMGLVIGPSATHSRHFYDQLARRLSEAFAVPMAQTLFDTADAAIERDVDVDTVRSTVRDYVTTYTPIPALRGLAQIRWSAVLSFCLDAAFDTAFQQDCAAHATRHPATILADPFQPLPPRHTPVFKLLGSAQRDDFCCSSVTYKARVSTWHARVRAFADLTQSAPVVCLGVADTPWLLADLLGAMSVQPMTLPSTLIFLADEVSPEDAFLRRYVSAKTSVCLARATTSDLIGSAIATQTSAVQLTLPYGERPQALLAAIAQYEDLVTVVNAHTHTKVSTDEHHRLADLLFSPSIPRWDPFVHQLDLRRSVSAAILDEVRTLATSHTGGSAAIVVTGSAAVGKTTVLKRVSFDLAVEGLDVLWLKPAHYQDSSRTLQTVFSRLRDVVEGRKLVVVMDDPVSFGAISASDVSTAAADCAVDIVLLVGVRSSDWSARDTLEITGGLQLMGEHSISDEFDEKEWAALPPYLVRLRAFPDQVTATRAMAAREVTTTRDTLSMLYWLLPGTKTGIQRSLREEYFRLGDAAAFTRLIIGDEQHSSELLKSAYGMTAVASHWMAPLPVEVLVAALGVSYGDFLEAAGAEAGWGLLYCVGGTHGDAAHYRTRNAVVTAVIVELMNGGRIGHGGEFSALQQLLSACTGTQPPYRDFVAGVLVRNQRLEELTYHEGLDLYDRAIAALPFRDKTLLHHRGIWIRTKGTDHDAARVALTEALSAPQYPYATKTEADEHIYTSLAANEVDALQCKQVTGDEAKQRVLDYLQRARTSGFFNPHAVHVEAVLMRRLVLSMPLLSLGDRARLISDAAANVDRTLMLLEHSRPGEGTSRDIDYLRDARTRLFELAPESDAAIEQASTLWSEQRNQAGFVLASRMLYRKATDSDKGTDFFEAHQFASAAIDTVRNDSGVVDRQLLETWMQIHYHWRVVRRTVVGVGGSIDWPMLYDVATVLTGTRGDGARYFHMYIKGLAAAHLNRWAEVESIFGELRRLSLPRHVLFSSRDELLRPNGKSALVQGDVTDGGTKRFLRVAEFKIDFMLARSSRWPRAGEIAHAHIVFSFAGPLAVAAQ